MSVNPDPLTEANSAVTPHKIYSGSLTPGEHQF